MTGSGGDADALAEDTAHLSGIFPADVSPFRLWHLANPKTPPCGILLEIVYDPSLVLRH